MPIFNNEKKIIGVTQLVNKLNGVPFNENDANIIEVMFRLFQSRGKTWPTNAPYFLG